MSGQFVYPKKSSATLSRKCAGVRRFPQLVPVERARAFIDLAEQSFNYDVHGLAGFQALGRLVDRCGCHRFEYSRLDEALACFDVLEEPAP